MTSSSDYWRKALAGQGQMRAVPPSDSPIMDNVYGAIGSSAGALLRMAGLDPRAAQARAQRVQEETTFLPEFLVGPQELEGALRRTIGGRGDGMDYATLGLTAVPFVPKPVKNIGKRGVRAGLKVARKVVGKKKGGVVGDAPAASRYKVQRSKTGRK